MSKIVPGTSEESKAAALTTMFFSVGKIIGKLSDDGLLRLVSAIRSTVKDPGTRDALDQIVDAIRMGPPNTTLIRKLISDSKYVEIHDLMMNTFFFKEIDIEEL